MTVFADARKQSTTATRRPGRSSARAHGHVAKAAVAAEQLVASRARQGDREAGVAHRTADEVRVQSVDGGLIEARERVGKLPSEDLLGQPQLVVLGVQRPRHRARVPRLVIGGLVEADVERPDRACAGTHGERGNGARVDSAGQEDAERARR